MWIKRDLESFFRQKIALPVKILRGLRQCGKSSLLAQLSEAHRRHLTLDDLQLRQLAQQDPSLFFAQNPWPLIIDEIQYAPNLFPEIKLQVDEQRQKNRAHSMPLRIVCKSP